jgi:hypothetical protein
MCAQTLLKSSHVFTEHVPGAAVQYREWDRIHNRPACCFRTSGLYRAASSPTKVVPESGPAGFAVPETGTAEAAEEEDVDEDGADVGAVFPARRAANICFAMSLTGGAAPGALKEEEDDADDDEEAAEEDDAADSCCERRKASRLARNASKKAIRW